MASSSFRQFGVLAFLGIAGAITFAALYYTVSPSASVDLQYNRPEIMAKGREYLAGLGYDLKDYQQDCWFVFAGDKHLFMQTRADIASVNASIRADSLSTHAWYMWWYDRRLPRSQAPETFHLWLSPTGRTIGFNHVINDSVAKPSVSEATARSMAEQFLRQQGVDLSSYELKSSSTINQLRRVDHNFEWSKKDTSAEGKLWARVQGDEVSGFHVHFNPTPEFRALLSRVFTTSTFVVIASATGMFLLFFFIVILFLKKYHEGEVGTQTAFWVFIGLFTVYLARSINIYPIIGSTVQSGDVNAFNIRIIMFVVTVFIFQLFLSVMVLAAWSVGESSSRTAWPGKLLALDSALFRKFLTADLGESVIRGYAWGLIVLGFYGALLALLLPLLRTGLFVQEVTDIPEAFVPALQPIMYAFTASVFNEVVFRLFFISYLREKTKKLWPGVLISSLLWTVIAFITWELPFGYLPHEYTFPVLFAFGLFFSWLFVRYDLATTITASGVITALGTSIPLFTSTGSSYHAAQWIVLLLLAIPLVVAVIGIIRAERFAFTPQTVPRHVQRISQRERMAKELEIARSVQMSLLPKVNPLLKGYDVAGICVPAQEVGGDYYDFVNLGARKIGIALGDVSGKGVPAAIYMTLTKGILQSHAEGNISPKKVLSKVNGLMYRTIERNSFVSMFYAILDVPGRTIRLARAGQCPIIMMQRAGKKGTVLTPKGMALGLEMGKVFDAVLEEEEIKLRSGEIMVFYTDGFTEAMNSRSEEFGERRLEVSVAAHSGKPAGRMIEAICEEVRDFTGSTPQHDDMTMVVLKVE